MVFCYSGESSGSLPRIKDVEASLGNFSKYTIIIATAKMYNQCATSVREKNDPTLEQNLVTKLCAFFRDPNTCSGPFDHISLSLISFQGTCVGFFSYIDGKIQVVTNHSLGILYSFNNIY